MIRRRWLIAGIAAVLLSTGLAGQQIFRTGTDVVSLNVTVTRPDGTFLSSIDRSQFQVFEDGAMQEITFFSADRQPLALSLLVDSSASMDSKIGVAQEAASGFVKRLGPKDVAQIVDFDSRVDIRQPFTADAAALEHAIRTITVGGSTSLYNALYIAITELKKLRANSPDIRRQAILILSDGEDTTSLVSYEEVLELAKRSEILVYAIGLKSKQDAPAHGFSEADYVLRTMSQETGGRLFFVEQIAQLPAVYQQIADELANQYTIGYTSKNPKRDGAWRAIVVQLLDKNAIARTKRGYYGPTVPKSADSGRQ